MARRLLKWKKHQNNKNDIFTKFLMQLEQIMADDVVDIRKRIEEMRNEVSAAIVSRQELNDATYDVGQNADISLGTQTIEPSTRATNDGTSPMHTAATSSPANTLVSDDMIKAHRGLETALKMPAFQLNIRNQTSNKLLLMVIGIQLLTNALLIIMVWMKLG
tara:strand:+ start:5676 stop:6161 length:486 start_codon:yes stop_codon:yes gene_type:complete